MSEHAKKVASVIQEQIVAELMELKETFPTAVAVEFEGATDTHEFNVWVVAVTDAEGNRLATSENYFDDEIDDDDLPDCEALGWVKYDDFGQLFQSTYYGEAYLPSSVRLPSEPTFYGFTNYKIDLTKITPGLVQK